MSISNSHGYEIGRLYYSAKVHAFMSNGAVLCDDGFGWKVISRVKQGFDPAEAFNKQKSKQEEVYKLAPTLKLYRESIAALGLANASKLHHAICLLGDDYDGIWSYCQDDCFPAIDLSVDEIRDICALYEISRSEMAKYSVATTASGRGIYESC